MIGFVIISHREPAQLLRLVRTLNRLYGNPPIACHHDFGQAPFEIDDVPPNVRFVLPSIATKWARWAVIDAILRALRLLYSFASPDWFVLLSGGDYPAACADQVLQELGSTNADAFIDFRAVGADEATASSGGPRNPQLSLSETSKGQALGRQRYLDAQFWIPFPKRTACGGLRIGRLTFHPRFRAPNLPFSRDLKCYHGDLWFSGSRAAATVLLDPDKRYRRVERFLRLRMFPEECYFQTVLCNERGLRLNRNNKRFEIWAAGSDHPKELDSADVSTILASGAHFARKFKHGDPVLDDLDAALACKQRAPSCAASEREADRGTSEATR